MRGVKELFWLSVSFNFVVSSVYIRSKENVICDWGVEDMLGMQTVLKGYAAPKSLANFDLFLFQSCLAGGTGNNHE